MSETEHQSGFRTPLSAGPGGSGLDGAAAPNGTLAIGTGSGFAFGTLQPGTPNVTIANTSGGIEISVSGGGSGGQFIDRTTDLTLGVAQSGNSYSTKGASGRVNFQLPTQGEFVRGTTFTFLIEEAFELAVLTAAGQTIRIGDNLSNVGGTLVDSMPGSVATVVWTSATTWLVTGPVGQWTTT